MFFVQNSDSSPCQSLPPWIGKVGKILCISIHDGFSNLSKKRIENYPKIRIEFYPDKKLSKKMDSFLSKNQDRILSKKRIENYPKLGQNSIRIENYPKLFKKWIVFYPKNRIEFYPKKRIENYPSDMARANGEGTTSYSNPIAY